MSKYVRVLVGGFSKSKFGFCSTGFSIVGFVELVQCKLVVLVAFKHICSNVSSDIHRSKLPGFLLSLLMII
jgi:hypothetical protein